MNSSSTEEVKETQYSKRSNEYIELKGRERTTQFSRTNWIFA